MATAEILIGTIAAGKSIWARNRASNGWIVINDDNLVMSLHLNYQLYDKKLKPLYKSIENHIFCSSILMGNNVIVDRALNLTRKSRSRWIALANSFDIPISAVVFDFCDPQVHAERRIASDGRGYDVAFWKKVAEHHIKIYEPPSLDEGFSTIIQEGADHICMKM
jgi:predicted kinase